MQEFKKRFYIFKLVDQISKILNKHPNKSTLVALVFLQTKDTWI